MSIVKEEKEEAYEYATVKRGDIVSKAVLSCLYISSDCKQYSFEEEGLQYDKMFVKVGDKVKKGDLLAQLKMDDALDVINNQEAEFKSIERQKNHIDRLISLGTQEAKLKGLSSKETRDSLSELYGQRQSANEELQLAQMKLEEAKKIREQRQIRSTIDGVVTNVLDFAQLNEVTNEEGQKSKEKNCQANKM